MGISMAIIHECKVNIIKTQPFTLNAVHLLKCHLQVTSGAILKLLLCKIAYLVICICEMKMRGLLKNQLKQKVKTAKYKKISQVNSKYEIN